MAFELVAGEVIELVGFENGELVESEDKELVRSDVVDPKVEVITPNVEVAPICSIFAENG